MVDVHSGQRSTSHNTANTGRATLWCQQRSGDLSSLGQPSRSLSPGRPAEPFSQTDDMQLLLL